LGKNSLLNLNPSAVLHETKLNLSIHNNGRLKKVFVMGNDLNGVM